MDDLSRFCCQNSQCPDFGLRDAGNLTVTGRLGKFRQYRLLYCRTCRDRFSERKGTPLYRAHLPEDKILSILEHIHEGCGVLKTARLVKVHPYRQPLQPRLRRMPATRTTNWWPTRLRPASSRWMGSSVFKCKTSRIGPSGPWPSGGCARSSSRSLATPDSSPGSIGPTDSSLTSVHRYAG